MAEQPASNCSPSLFWRLRIYWKGARRTCWICCSRVPAFSAAARETNQCCFKSSWKLRKPWSPAAWRAAIQGLLSFQPLQRLHWQNVCGIWRSTMWQWKNLRETKQGRGRKEGGGRIKWECGSKLKAGGQKSKEKYANHCKSDDENKTSLSYLTPPHCFIKEYICGSKARGN